MTSQDEITRTADRLKDAFGAAADVMTASGSPVWGAAEDVITSGDSLVRIRGSKIGHPTDRTRWWPATPWITRSRRCLPGSVRCYRSRARTSTAPARSTGRSTRSAGLSSRATPAGRCSVRPEPSTACCSAGRPGCRTPGSCLPPPRYRPTLTRAPTRRCRSPPRAARPDDSGGQGERNPVEFRFNA
jgi:hypothetical protein